MATKLWDELDALNDEVTARLGDLDPSFPIATLVVFTQPFKEIKAGTKGVIIDRMKDYYALSVKGEYVEAIHKSYIKEIK